MWWLCETVALWNSLGPFGFHVTPNGIEFWEWPENMLDYILDVTGGSSVKSVTCGCFVISHVHSHKYLLLSCIPVLLPIEIENPHHYWNNIDILRDFIGAWNVTR